MIRFVGRDLAKLANKDENRPNNFMFINLWFTYACEILHVNFILDMFTGKVMKAWQLIAYLFAR